MPLVLTPIAAIVVVFYTQDKSGSGSRLCRSHLLESRHFFVVKITVTPTAAILFLIWYTLKAHGIGPIVQQPSAIHGSILVWAMVVSLMSCGSNMATLLTPHVSFASQPPSHFENKMGTH